MLSITWKKKEENNKKTAEGSAFRSFLFMEQLLAGPDRHLQPILGRCNRARPHLIVGTIRVVGQVEIHKEAITYQSFGLQVASGGIRFFTCQRIHKRQEVAMLILIDG